MAFISMYNSQEGVAFSDVQVKSRSRRRCGAVPGRGGASQWEERCARRRSRSGVEGGPRRTRRACVYYTSVFGLGRCHSIECRECPRARV